MGADHDVDGARCDLLQNRLGFLRRLEPREQRHARRKRREPLGEIVVVLVRQQRGRNEHRHLAVVLHGFEGRPHGDLGFAVPHVAADEPVHRLARLHVVGDVFDGFQLIGRFLVFEGGFELVVHRAVVSIGVALDELAVGIEVDQFLRHLLDVLLHPRGRFGPARAAQPVQAGRMALGPAVSLNLVEPVQRHVQRVAAVKFQNQIIAVEVLHRETLEPSILGDAVLDVDDVVADVEIFQ